MTMISDDPMPGLPRRNPGQRRSDFDVTNTVQVSSVAAVREAVQALFERSYPNASFDPLWMAFLDFEQLFDGLLATYTGCDTVYHDKQHSLDVTLATARILAGHEMSRAEDNRIGPERAAVALITALFHDSGYIRRSDEKPRLNGAEYTLWHVSRSAEFLVTYMNGRGMADFADIAARIVHFTGYELNLDDIELDDPRDRLIGHFLGTADLIAQMADRCYLEKCRDRLYSEFVLAGVAMSSRRKGQQNVLYGSGIDLLKKTPDFFRSSARVRLNDKFHRVYRYINVLYEGRNPYIEFIDHNLKYLGQVIETGDWSRLRRRPPCFTVLPNPLRSVSALVSDYLAQRAAPATALTTP
jgi:hypothetical protein